MALPQRQEPDDEWRREEETQSRRVADNTRPDENRNRFDKDMGRRNDLQVRRRRTGMAWMWLIIAALVVWWAISHARHNRMIAPGTNNNPAVTQPNNTQPNTGQPNNGPNAPTPNAPTGQPTPNNNAPPAPPQK
jgi:hypothetical protein